MYGTVPTYHSPRARLCQTIYNPNFQYNMLRRTTRWLAYILAATTLVSVVFIIMFDWNWLRQPIARVVTEQTGRTLEINGDLNVKLGWPLTRIQVTDVTFANPAWAKQPLMFAIKQIDADIVVPQLFKRHFVLSAVRLRQPNVYIEESRDGRKNWLFDRQQRDDKAQIEIKRLVLDNGHIEYASPLRNISLKATLSTQQVNPKNAASTDIIVFTAQGRFKDFPLKASGSGGSVLTLSDEATPYPLNIDTRIGHTRLRAVGTVTSLLRWTAVDLNLTLSGASLDQLYPLIGIALPRTPAYLTKGHLMHLAQQWRYEKFTGRIGKSDIAGNFQVERSGKRPFLQGNLTMQLLDLADLGALVGMGSSTTGARPDQKPDDTTQQTTEQQSTNVSKQRDVLPKLPFRTGRWSSVDADVKIRAKRIQRARALPIENLATRIQMRDAVITLAPLNFGVAGGILAGAITLNGQHDPIQARVKLGARKIMLNKLFPTVKLTKTSIGQVNGEADLTGTGNAVDKMLASANGKLALVVEGGEISKLMLETIGLHLWEMLQLKITGDKAIKINCAVADFGVKQGVMQINTLVLDTQITTITGRGNIDLKQETLNLDLQPHTKVFSPLALRSPIYIRGSFAKPQASIDKTKVALRGAGALILGAINPFLTLIPLIDSGPGKNSECGRLIHQAQQPRR